MNEIIIMLRLKQSKMHKLTYNVYWREDNTSISRKPELKKYTNSLH